MMLHRNYRLSSMGLGRMLSNISTNSLTFSVPRDKNLMRFDRNFFFGKYIDDDICQDNQLRDAREHVSKLLGDKNGPQPSEFICIASNIRKYLCSDHAPSEFQLPKNSMYFGNDSPSQQFLEKALLKCFRTSWNAIHGHRENFSGWALVGARGTGKSTLTRLVALLSGLLLPNFQSAFVSAIDIPNLNLQEFITHAALEAKVITNYVHSDVIGHFTYNKFAIGLFIDELPELYQDNDVNWRQVHSMVSTTEPTFVLANGSSSILPAMIKKDVGDFSLLRNYVKNPLPSLNITKLVVEYQSKFSTKQHYLSYFEHLNYDFLKNPSNALINKVHIFSGGVLRLMSEDLKSFTGNYSVLLDKHRKNYPGTYQLEYKIYVKLAEKFLQGVIPHQWDAFDLPTIDENELLTMIRDYYHKQGSDDLNEYLKLQQLVESDTLFVIKRGISNEYTYGCPAHLLITINKPIVFISHQWFDNNDNCGTKELLSDIIKKNTNVFFIYCENPDAQQAMRKYRLPIWDHSHLNGISLKQFPETLKCAGIALINEQYLTSLEQGHDNGCSNEFESFLKQLSCTESAPPVIMLTSLSNIQTVIERLVACFPHYKDLIMSIPYYQYTDQSLENHIEQVCNKSIERFALDRQCFKVEE